MDTFYLGTHKPDWIGKTTVPLFISLPRVIRRRSFPPVGAPWILDSGAFTTLMQYGEHQLSAEEYAEVVQRISARSPSMLAAVQQDYMCEPFMLERTGLSVQEHQSRSLENYLQLRRIAPSTPWVPVLQGWKHADYLWHERMYRSVGIDLSALPLVGVGSVCKRQATAEASVILHSLAMKGLRLHAFGYKVKGLPLVADAITSADSMAWSYHARRRPPITGHTHMNCANCLEYALEWRSSVLAAVPSYPHPTKTCG